MSQRDEKKEKTNAGETSPEEGSAKRPDGEERPKKPKSREKSEKEKLKEQLKETEERLLRVMAEYDNYRKRTEKEKLSSVSLGATLAVEKILPVLDTIEIAADAATADAEYKKGVEMTVTLFRSALQALGVEEIEALGVGFDPNFHNCVASEPSEEQNSGSVTKVMQKGYKMGDRVIRPSMVAVAS